MSTIRLPPNEVRSATMPCGSGDDLANHRRIGALRVRSHRGDRSVGFVGRNDRDELALVGDVQRIDAEHVARAEHLRLDREACLVEDHARTASP